jgi:hypothetical protein
MFVAEKSLTMGKVYSTDYRHWHASSEKYTGGDSLVSLLQAGWAIHTVACREYTLTGGRTSRIYQCHLKLETASMEMGVIANPFVTRLVEQSIVQSSLASTYMDDKHRLHHP